MNDDLPEVPPAPPQPFPPEQIHQMLQAWPAVWTEHSLSALNLTWEDIPRFMATIVALGNSVRTVPQLVEDRQKAMDVLACVLQEKQGVPLMIYKKAMDRLPKDWSIEYTPMDDRMRVRLVAKQ